MKFSNEFITALSAVYQLREHDRRRTMLGTSYDKVDWMLEHWLDYIKESEEYKDLETTQHVVLKVAFDTIRYTDVPVYVSQSKSGVVSFTEL